jgi:predicted RNase H-like HicB family nuclease
MVYSVMREFIVYQDDDGTWVAEAKELPGVHMRGKTQQEALEKIQTALRIYYPCRCED